MEDKELKKQLKKVPDVDKKGEPIFKIDENADKSTGNKSNNAPNLPKNERTRLYQY